MGRKSFYNEYEAVGVDSIDMCNRFNVFVDNLANEYYEKGYTYREIYHILIGELTLSEAESVLTRAIAIRKEKKKNTKESLNFLGVPSSEKNKNHEEITDEKSE